MDLKSLLSGKPQFGMDEATVRRLAALFAHGVATQSPHLANPIISRLPSQQSELFSQYYQREIINLLRQSVRIKATTGDAGPQSDGEDDLVAWAKEIGGREAKLATNLERLRKTMENNVLYGGYFETGGGGGGANAGDGTQKT
jgi:hypothetical protein